MKKKLITSMILVSIILFGIAIGNVKATTVKFEDNRLYEIVKEKLDDMGKTYTESDSNTIEADFSTIKSFTITNGGANTGVKSLSGLEQLTSLEELTILGNPVTDLNPISNLTNLKKLEVSNINTNNFDFLSNLTNLEDLTIFWCEPMDISAIRNLTNLKKCYIEFGFIRDVKDFENLTNLKELTLARLNIEDITLLNNLNLDHLNISENSIYVNIPVGTTSAKLPKIFETAKQPGSLIYCADEFETKGPVESISGTTVNFKSTAKAGDEAIITIPNGNAKRTYIQYLFVGAAHNIEIEQSSNGTIKTDKQSAKEGNSIAITVVPNEGYELDKLTVVDADQNSIEVNNNNFIMPDADVKISATFKQIDSNTEEQENDNNINGELEVDNNTENEEQENNNDNIADETQQENNNDNITDETQQENDTTNEASKKTTNPKTGDNIFIMITVFAVSIISLFVMTKIKNNYAKKNNK